MYASLTDEQKRKIVAKYEDRKRAMGATCTLLTLVKVVAGHVFGTATLPFDSKRREDPFAATLAVLVNGGYIRLSD